MRCLHIILPASPIIKCTGLCLLTRLHFPHCVRLWLHSQLTFQNILPGGWLGSPDAGWRLHTFWKTCVRCTARMVPLIELGPMLPHFMQTASVACWYGKKSSVHWRKSKIKLTSYWDVLMEKTFLFSNCQMGLNIISEPHGSRVLMDAQMSVHTALHGWLVGLLRPFL